MHNPCGLEELGIRFLFFVGTVNTASIHLADRRPFSQYAQRTSRRSDSVNHPYLDSSRAGGRALADLRRWVAVRQRTELPGVLR
jgi:hypothetical protein